MADRQLTFGIRLKADGGGFVGEVKLAGDEVKKFGDAAKQAAKETEDASRQSIASAARWGTAISAAAVAAGTAVVYAVKQQIDAMADLAITSERLQITVEELSALDYVARLNNVSNQALARSFRELNKDAFEAARGNQAVAQQFDAVGISVRDSSGKLKDAKTLFLELADVVSAIENPVVKSAVATRFLGARAEELLPVLNKGSAGIREMYGEAERFGAVVSGEAARAANEFNDNITRLKVSTEAWARSMANAVVPGINHAIEAMLEARRRGLNFAETLGAGLDASTRSAEELRAEATRLREELVKLEEDQQRRVRAGGSNIFGLAFNFGQDVTTQPAIFAKRSQFESVDAAAAVAERRNRERRERIFFEGRAALAREEPGRGATFDEITAERLRKPERSGRAGRDQGADLQAQIGQRIALLQAEDDAGRKLTQSEQLRVKIEQDLASGKLKLTSQQMIAIDAGLEEWRVLELASDAKREAAREEQHLAQERERTIETAQRETDSLQKQADMFGKSRAQVAAWEESQLRAKLAIQQASRAEEADIEVTRRLIAEKSDQVAIEEELAHLRAGRELADMLADLELETRLIGASNAERTKAILLRKLEREGISATGEELAKIDRIAAGIALNEQAQRTQRALDDAAGAAARFGEALVLNFRDASSAVKQLEQDLLRIGTRALVTEPLEQWFRELLGSTRKGISAGGGGGAFFDLLGDAFISVFGLHTGGIAGEDASFTRRAPRTLFAHAPRYHSGGLAPNEVPAILQAGEEVLTQRDPRHRANGGANAGTTHVHYNTFNVAPGTSRATASQIGAGFARELDLLTRRAVAP